MKFKFFLYAIFFSTYFFCTVSFAENVESKVKELTVLQTQIKKVTKKLNNLKSKKSALVSELKRLDTQYGKSAVLLNQLEKQVKQQIIALKKNQQQIVEKRQLIDSQKQELESQIKAAYGLGRNEALKLMLSQQDSALSSRMMVYYEYLNKARLENIAKINKDLQELKELEEQHLNETKLLEGKLEKRKQERSFLRKKKAERKSLLAKISSQFSSKKQQLHQFNASEKRLKSLIFSLQQATDDFPLGDISTEAFSKLKGKLPWPVRGKLIKSFGVKRSDSQWDGVLIAAKEGANIRAVTRGRVVYADWLRGYGLLTIIDHGKGYLTLYAFNQSLYSTVGEWVDAGTLIATVGQSGGRSFTGLYFGIRKKGKPVDPVKWCRKIRRGKVR